MSDQFWSSSGVSGAKVGASFGPLTNCQPMASMLPRKSLDRFSLPSASSNSPSNGRSVLAVAAVESAACTGRRDGQAAKINTSTIITTCAAYKLRRVKQRA